jgi:polyisoprenoid-binding protein YceI
MNRKLVIGAVAVVALGVIGVAAAIGITMLRSDDPNLRTEAPAIPTTGAGLDAAPSATAGTTASGSGVTTSSGVFHFVIDQSGSEAKYVVRETLRGVVGANAVGTTKTITGDLYLTQTGLATGQVSKFSVDLRTLRTDESRRDDYVRQSVLRTNQFPMAEFVVESLSGFPASYVEGTEVSMTLTGTMTIRGQSRPLTWQVKARRAGDTLTGIADVTFNMTDFGINPPDVGFARAESGVQLQITILAKQAA